MRAPEPADTSPAAGGEAWSRSRRRLLLLFAVATAACNAALAVFATFAGAFLSALSESSQVSFDDGVRTDVAVAVANTVAYAVVAVCVRRRSPAALALFGWVLWVVCCTADLVFYIATLRGGYPFAVLLAAVMLVAGVISRHEFVAVRGPR